ncbi:MAG TPA: isoprenylcysteine carboxylmethyltransferase family protein [Thermoplasmata archaeon]|nr:isoprenylcysteine carboxylmethyltransferase family protein [Thermoplasmata archaeon]
MKTKEGIATEIAKKEELTPEERKEELLRAGVDFHKIPEGPILIVTWVIWVILCLLPTIAKNPHLGFLDFALDLYAIEIPMIIVWISAALLVAIFVVLPARRVTLSRRKKGGCGDEHHTVVLVKDGLYKVVRHPEYTFYLWLTILVSIVMSPAWGFTILTIIGDILIIIALEILAKQEEEFNIGKWGDEYRQYMKEVPRFNFIKGLWNLRKKRYENGD